MSLLSEKLIAIARPVSFLAGAQLVRQGETSRGAFFIRQGAVEAMIALPGGGMLAVAALSEGDMFGEMALIEQGVCSATVIARTNVDGWFIERSDFRTLVAGRDAAALEAQRAVTGILAAKLAALNARFRDHAALEDRPAAGPAPAGDPLARVERKHKASFDWRAFLPILPFFEGFAEDEIDEVAARGRALELPRGAWVFVAGRPAQACYLVVRGALEIFTGNSSTERRVAIAGPGELVGFMAVINRASRANNARVREGCLLLEIPAVDFLELYNGSSGATVKLQRSIHRSLMRSLARTNTQLTRLITHARLEASKPGVSKLEAIRLV